jgi:cysteine desulfurase/selenocysteine lyase
MHATSPYKKDFPIFQNNENLVYLDSAATSQRPQQVIEAVLDFERNYNSNVHRGLYSISVRATERYEEAREKFARFIHAQPEEIIFVRGATEALNTVALGLGIQKLSPGDEVLVTRMDHHSNIVPWQLLSWKGIRVKFVPLRRGTVSAEDVASMVTSRTRVISLAHVSNVLGSTSPVEEIGKIARDAGAYFVVDGAQSVPHMPVDVRRMGCDFLAVSGHKMCAPTGIGVLYGRRELLESMEPVFGGGEMISEVTEQGSKWAEVPQKFEPGTPNISGAIGLGAAVDYLNSVGMENIVQMEKELMSYALGLLLEQEDIEIYGPLDPEQRTGVISFNMKGVHNHDLAELLSMHGIAIRSGHHCAQPLMDSLGLPGTSRISFYLYNDKNDVDAFVAALQHVRKIFA